MLLAVAFVNCNTNYVRVTSHHRLLPLQVQAVVRLFIMMLACHVELAMAHTAANLCWHSWRERIVFVLPFTVTAAAQAACYCR
jgi:hypothetical protein